MASDQQVSAQAVLRAVMRLRRQGTDQTLRELETVEPDLASFVMEEFSLLHRGLLALGGPPKRSRRLQRRLEEVVLTCITTMREAHSGAPSPARVLFSVPGRSPAGHVFTLGRVHASDRDRVDRAVRRAGVPGLPRPRGRRAPGGLEGGPPWGEP